MIVWMSTRFMQNPDIHDTQVLERLPISPDISSIDNQ